MIPKEVRKFAKHITTYYNFYDIYLIKNSEKIIWLMVIIEYLQYGFPVIDASNCYCQLFYKLCCLMFYLWR